MTRSFVLRLIPGQHGLADLVGELEAVATGRTDVFRSAEELLALLRAEPAADAVVPDGTSTAEVNR